MWIEEVTDKQGKKAYKFSERYIDPRTNKRRKVSITYKNKSRETQKNALYELNSKIDKKLDTESTVKKVITISELYQEFLEIYAKQVSDGTYEVTKFMLKNIVDEFDETTLLSSVDTVTLTSIFDNLIYKKDLSNRYVRIIKIKTNLLMKFAMRRGYILENPVSNMELNFKRDSAPKK